MSHLPASTRPLSGRFTGVPEGDEGVGRGEGDLGYHRGSGSSHYDRHVSYDQTNYGQEQLQEYYVVSPYTSPQTHYQHTFHDVSPTQQFQQPTGPAPSGYFGYGDRRYSHARTVSGVSEGLGVTPSPYEYNNNVGDCTGHNNFYYDHDPRHAPACSLPKHDGDGDGDRGGVTRPPIYDKPLPNYKPTALRRRFLIALVVVILGAIAGLVLGLMRLPVDKAAMVATKRDMTNMLGEAGPWRRQGVFDDSGTGTETGTQPPPATQVPAEDAFAGLYSDPIVMTPTPTPAPDGPTPVTDDNTTPPTTVGYVPQSEFADPFAPPSESESIPPVVSTVTDDLIESNVQTSTAEDSYFSPPPPGAPAPTDYGGLDDGGATPTLAVPNSAFGQLATPVTTVVTDVNGQVATVVTSRPVAPSVQVLTNAAGQPTMTLTTYPYHASGQPDNNSDAPASAYTTTVASYILGMFVPTLVAILLAIPIRILDTNARIFHPWHQLARPQGAFGQRSLSLEPFGWAGYLEGFRVLGSGQWLLFATTALTMLSAVLIPLSAEAIRIDLQGPNCRPGTMTNKGCFFITTAFMQGTIACLMVLGLMALILLSLAVMLGPRWRTGVAANPSSICGIASLCLHEDVRRLFTNLPVGSAGGTTTGLPIESAMEAVFGGRRFRLGYFYSRRSAVMEYGIVLADGDDSGEGRSLSEQIGGGMRESIDELWEAENMLKHPEQYQQSEMFTTPRGTGEHSENKHHLPFLMLGYAGRLVLLAILLGLLGVIGYYQTSLGQTGFERFMSGEGFGVRFLFAGAGVVVNLFWASFFDSLAIVSPFRLLSRSPRPASSSILLSPPRNGFSGLWSGLRRGDLLLAVTSLISICAELLPILLANTPFRSTQLYMVNRACTYAGMALMGTMAVVLAGSFVVKWPSMPLDPSTIAGAMWYVCDSRMVSGGEGKEGMSGLSRLSREERDRRVVGMGLKYRFGRIAGVSGKSRIGVDVVDWRPGMGEYY